MDFQSECCKFGNFRENFILANNAKKICIRLPASANDRVMLPFREGFILAKFSENKTLAKINRNWNLKPSSKIFLLTVPRRYF